MFKAKRHRGNIRKVEEEKDSDTEINVDIEQIKLEQKVRSEVKSGMTPEDLIKPLDLSEKEKLEEKEEDGELSALDYVLKNHKKGETMKEIKEDAKKLETYIYDDTALYKPEGFSIPDLVPHLPSEQYTRREVEAEETKHHETLEELLEIKQELKREKREQFEASF